MPSLATTHGPTHAPIHGKVRARVAAGAAARHRTKDASAVLTDPPEQSRFFASHDEIRAFVLREWDRALDYRLKQELWTYDGDRITVRFEYEWHDETTDQWVRTRGAEQWQIGQDGLIRCQDRIITDDPILPA